MSVVAPHKFLMAARSSRWQVWLHTSTLHGSTQLQLLTWSSGHTPRAFSNVLLVALVSGCFSSCNHVELQHPSHTAVIDK